MLETQLVPNQESDLKVIVGGGLDVQETGINHFRRIARVNEILGKKAKTRLSEDAGEEEIKAVLHKYTGLYNDRLKELDQQIKLVDERIKQAQAEEDISGLESGIVARIKRGMKRGRQDKAVDGNLSDERKMDFQLRIGVVEKLEALNRELSQLEQLAA